MSRPKSSPQPPEADVPISERERQDKERIKQKGQYNGYKITGFTDAKTEKKIVFYVLIGLIIFALIFILSYYQKA